jgi:RsiW-degrading membrane proteinase PrsW (M82 family)
MVWLSVLLSLVPGPVIAYLIWRQDRYDQEPRLALALSFLLGMLITVPAFLLERWAVLQGWEDNTKLLSIFLTAFIIVSLVEETFKAAALLVYPYRQSFFNEPLDGIVYAVMIAMGFATAENLLYAFQHGLTTTVVRAFTAVPAHGAFAIILGYYVGLSKFDAANKWKLIFTGFGLAIFCHGAYDFFLVQEMYDWLIGIALPVLGICIFLGIRMLKKHTQDSTARFGTPPAEEELS